MANPDKAMLLPVLHATCPPPQDSVWPHKMLVEFVLHVCYMPGGSAATAKPNLYSFSYSLQELALVLKCGSKEYNKQCLMVRICFGTVGREVTFETEAGDSKHLLLIKFVNDFYK